MLSSRRLYRLVAVVPAVVPTVVACLMLRHQIQHGVDWLEGALVYPLFGTLSALAWWFALCGQHAESRARIMFSLVGAMILGVIGVIAGFFGGGILYPQSNMAGLLGIFTGPMGFAAGAVVGAIVGCQWTRRQPRPEVPPDRLA
jgi:membrane associated rhomboid family serine protease